MYLRLSKFSCSISVKHKESQTCRKGAGSCEVAGPRCALNVPGSEGVRVRVVVLVVHLDHGHDFGRLPHLQLILWSVFWQKWSLENYLEEVHVSHSLHQLGRLHVYFPVFRVLLHRFVPSDRRMLLFEEGFSFWVRAWRQPSRINHIALLVLQPDCLHIDFHSFHLFPLPHCAPLHWPGLLQCHICFQLKILHLLILWLWREVKRERNVT